MIQLWCTAIAMLLDRLIGDPKLLPHPVIYIGKWISFLDHHLNQEHMSVKAKRLGGLMLVVSTLCLAYFIPWGVLYIVFHYSKMLGWLINTALISTTIAWKGLADAGRGVFRKIQNEGIIAARAEVAMIVGRDTSNLDESEVVRATVETVAENIVDAIISPVLFACIGGAPLAFLYRAANTLDSMVGYRSDRYRDFGWCSAKLDDILNFISARITIFLMLVAIWVSRMNVVSAYKTMRLDAHKHLSPNSGIPESLVAGALGVQLGGLNFYKGVPSFRATMGEPLQKLARNDILRTIRILHATCWLLFGLMIFGGLLYWFM